MLERVSWGTSESRFAPSEPRVTATVTSDFREEYEAESAKRLRRRFLWYCGVTLGLSLLSFVAVGIMLVLAPVGVRLEAWAVTIISVISVVPYIWAFVFARKRRVIPRATLVRVVYWLIVFGSVMNFIIAPISPKVQEALVLEGQRRSAIAVAARDAESLKEEAIPKEEAREPAVEAASDITGAVESVGEDDGGLHFDFGLQPSPGSVTITSSEPAGEDGLGKAKNTTYKMSYGAGWMIQLFVMHFFAALFIPWTPKEAISPLIPLLALNAVGMLAFKVFISDSESYLTVALVVLLSPLLGVPGTLICWWRHSRFRDKFHYSMLRGRYGEFKQELTDARRIHEALFPSPIADGPIRMDYIYEPMRQIGGDFLFTRYVDRGEHSGILNLVLIDVTGHGLTAALTVNRIAGDLLKTLGYAEDDSWIEDSKNDSATRRENTATKMATV